MRYILAILRTALLNLKHDKGAMIMSFILPVAFFSIFALIFGRSDREGTAKIPVIAVDEDRSESSQRFLKALQAETSLDVRLAPEKADGEKSAPTLYRAATAEEAVRGGKVSVALIIPQGFGAAPMSFTGGSGKRLTVLADKSDPIAPQMLNGMLQKTMMTAMPEDMIQSGGAAMDKFAGGLTPQQKTMMSQGLAALHARQNAASNAAGGSASTDSSANGSGGAFAGGLVQVDTKDLLGEKKTSPMIAFYAAGVGVMFMLFTASGAGGTLLDEQDSGTLDRVLSSKVTMTTLLLGKLTYLVMLGLTQMIVMFVWGALVFHLDLWTHLPGFFIMAICTALATSSYGLILATACHTRAQLASFSTLITLIISAVGGSMFPRFLMPAEMQKWSLVFFNSWALDGFRNVFWRELPLSQLWPQVGALLGFALLFLVIARQLARRWESA